VIESGTAGASVLREHDRRAEKWRARAEAEIATDAEWRQKIKLDHPVLGRIRTGLTPKPVLGREPQNVSAWGTGFEGERAMGHWLDDWVATGVGIALHDRRIPRSKANIDHIAVAPSGVWVIDAKKYTGLVEQVDVGGWLTSDLRLKVGGRNKSRLAAGVEWQRTIVAEVLDAATGGSRPPVRGVLAFVGAEWRLFSRPFVFEGIHVAWPKVVIDFLNQEGDLTSDQIESTASVLLKSFPSA
jgi:hypothetical protein